MKGEQVPEFVVPLVGAGPGDPDLLTLKGRDTLRQTDILFYDPRVSPALFQFLPEGARQVPAETGTAGPKILQACQSGHQVVRLVSGDPYLDPGTVSEALELAAMGIRTEPVPGLPMETTLPAYAGIAPAFGAGNWMACRFAKAEAFGWEGVADFSGTRIIFPEGRGVQQVAGKLLRAGLSPDTPVALIEKGGRMEQRVWTGSLDGVTTEYDPHSATLFILGEAVKSREELAWLERKPLFGRRILLTRAKGQNQSMAEKIRRLGGEAVEFPAIEFRPPRHQEVLDQALRRLEAFDWVVFTSVNGVNFFFRHLNRLNIDIRQMHRARLAAVGPRTAQALEEKGLRVEILPEAYQAENLIEALKPHVSPGETVLLPRANIARKLLATELTACGCQVTDVDVYDTVPGVQGIGEVVGMLKRGELHFLTFTSSSTVRNFVKELRRVESGWKSLLDGVRVVCIGPITAQTAEQYGVQVDAVAGIYTVDGLIEAMIQLPSSHEEESI
ncbi:uroporphyrinogen-III synthase [Kroppenstedtia eburnea]|uniref:uroporphyrinogen-III C-methyltransferase n=1 Tax=Kroppenstedtia eburnea TaxID=714067 RepID=A0A1N7M243_9BACL|nr:uroporphyrinogen-III synthase [Kroppenstedtia eburnea]QKI81789.1 HemD protein [Kroppenstedtia eburnea]SIS80186.1 uroporphyrinogen-III synthase /uroporphyrinogen-III C-methyltransferase [Kroppenstedtia eburnea]